MAVLQLDQPGHNHDNQDDTTSNKTCLEADQLLVKTTNRTNNQSQSTQIEATQTNDHKSWANWVYPPEFYDRLPKVHFTEGALAELDRRNRLTRHCQKPPRPQEAVSVLLRVMPRKEDLGRFARHGGPDLKDVRNYPPPKAPPTNVLRGDKPSLSNTTTSTGLKIKKSTPYDANFEQHLKDYNVQATYDSQKPANWTEIRAALIQRRPSLTSSQFSEGAFNTFQNNDARAGSEDAVMAHVIPVILGEGALVAGRQASDRNIQFNNLAPLTDGTITQPKPDIYYGARPEELSRPVRDALGRYIIPSTVQSRPLAPNFFVEVKGPDGTSAVVNRQARYDGAIGSRVMHSLQQYKKEEPTYDGHAYSFSSTYHDGALKIFAHHATAPTSEGGQLQYCMTQLRSFSLIDGRETFVEGVTAFRNARDLAKQYRDGFIHTANEMSQFSGIIEAVEEVDEQDDGQNEAAKTRKPRTALANEPPVASTTSSVTKKGTKRKHPSPSPEVSGPLTRAAKRRLLCSGEM